MHIVQAMLTFCLMLSAQLELNAGADKYITEQMESSSIVSLKRLMLQSSRKKNSYCIL